MNDPKGVPFQFYHIQNIHEIEATKEVQNQGKNLQFEASPSVLMCGRKIDLIELPTYDVYSTYTVCVVDGVLKWLFVYVYDSVMGGVAEYALLISYYNYS